LVPEWLTGASSEAYLASGTVLVRLITALLLGAVVALVYYGSRSRIDRAESFTVTLVLLSILIAMVTQVIGDSVARAFSLVGALSIVRFRTVVRDTQDTAYVIFAVAVGMATGTGHVILAIIGIVVVSVAAFAMRRRSSSTTGGSVPEQLPFELTVRLPPGRDPEEALAGVFDQFKVLRRLTMVATARQGLAVDVAYRAALVNEGAAAALVNALNRVDGVQAVTLQRAASSEWNTP
jgi:hypothetical protein